MPSITLLDFHSATERNIYVNAVIHPSAIGFLSAFFMHVSYAYQLLAFEFYAIIIKYDYLSYTREKKT